MREGSVNKMAVLADAMYDEREVAAKPKQDRTAPALFNIISGEDEKRNEQQEGQQVDPSTEFVFGVCVESMEQGVV